MLQSIIDTVNQMGKREWDTTGFMFMNGKNCNIDEVQNDNEFNVDKTADMAVYQNISEIQSELPGVEVQADYNKDDNVNELDDEEDMNDFAEASANNACEVSIVDNIQPN